MSLHIFYKIKRLPGWGIEPITSCIGSSRLNHYSSSVDGSEVICIVYAYCTTWRLVTYVRRRTSRPTRPRHDVAGPSLHMDLFKAKTGGGAGQGLGPGREAQMWRRTLARWRKSQRLERWLVAVQLTSCHDRLTGPAPDSRIGGPGPVVWAGSPPVGASDVGPKKPSASLRRQVDVDVCKSGGHKPGRYHNKTVFVGRHLN